MSYYFVDRIIEVEKGKRIRAKKGLSLTEDYLQDHFPEYPVLPGVMMLESLLQTARWLVWSTENFRPFVIVLDEVKQLKFGKFVRPGRALDMEVNWMEREGDKISFTGQGKVDGETAVNCRFSVRLADRSSLPESAGKDIPSLQEAYRTEFDQLTSGMRG